MFTRFKRISKLPVREPKTQAGDAPAALSFPALNGGACRAKRSDFNTARVWISMCLMVAGNESFMLFSIARGIREQQVPVVSVEG